MDDDEAGALAPIGDALPPIKPLTSVQRRRLKSAVAIADDPSEGITYQHTVLCQTCMPYRDPGDSTRIWERQQGMVSLRIEAGSVRDPAAHQYVDVGLPFGAKPRLILAHLNREALLQGSPRIEVENSLTAFIRRVTNYNSVNAREIGLFRQQLSRFAAAEVRMAVDRSDHAYQINTHIIDAFDLWPGGDERQRVLWPAEVELSPRYYASLTKHAVPLDERALGALANSPMALDVYAWLAQRLHRVDARRPQSITWVSLHLQFGQGFKRLRKFRETFLGVLDAVHAQYRAARIEADERGVTLRHSPPPVKGRIAAVAPRRRIEPDSLPAITPRPTATGGQITLDDLVLTIPPEIPEEEPFDIEDYLDDEYLDELPPIERSPEPASLPRLFRLIARHSDFAAAVLDMPSLDKILVSAQEVDDQTPGLLRVKTAARRLVQEAEPLYRDFAIVKFEDVPAEATISREEWDELRQCVQQAYEKASALEHRLKALHRKTTPPSRTP